MPFLAFYEPPRWFLLWENFYCFLKFTQTIFIIGLLVPIAKKNFVTLITVCVVFLNMIMVALNLVILSVLIYIVCEKSFNLKIETANFIAAFILIVIIGVEVVPKEATKFNYGMGELASHDTDLEEDASLFYYTIALVVLQFSILLARILVFFAAKAGLSKFGYIRFLLICMLVPFCRINPTPNRNRNDGIELNNIRARNLIELHPNAIFAVFGNPNRGNPIRTDIGRANPNRENILPFNPIPENIEPLLPNQANIEPLISNQSNIESLNLNQTNREPIGLNQENIEPLLPNQANVEPLNLNQTSREPLNLNQDQENIELIDSDEVYVEPSFDPNRNIEAEIRIPRYLDEVDDNDRQYLEDPNPNFENPHVQNDHEHIYPVTPNRRNIDGIIPNLVYKK